MLYCMNAIGKLRILNRWNNNKKLNTRVHIGFNVRTKKQFPVDKKDLRISKYRPDKER